MSVPRRGFLKTGVLAVVASGLPLSIHRLAFARTPSTTDSLRYLGLEDFGACIGESFAVESAAGPAERIRLVRIVDLRSDAVKNDPSFDGRESFALIFSGAGGREGSPSRLVADRLRDRRTASGAALLADGYHQLRNDRLGDFPLAVSPAGRDADGPLYSAVINRLYP